MNYRLIRPATHSLIGHADTELAAIEGAARHSRDFNYAVEVYDETTSHSTLIATCHPGGKVERP